MRRAARPLAREPRERGPVRRPIRDPRAARPRRHGNGLPRARQRARRDGGDQGAAARRRARVERPRRAAVPLGDPPRPARAPPQRLLGVRGRRGPRAPLHLHGARRGREPRPAGARGRRAAPGRGLGRGAAGGARPRGDPRGRHRPPRPQDREPDARPPRRRARHGLRHRQAAQPERQRGDRHRHRRADGHARVHEPRAAARRRGRLPLRPVLARDRRLRAVHG